jgi:hypothetical protein
MELYQLMLAGFSTDFPEVYFIFLPLDEGELLVNFGIFYRTGFVYL